MEGDPVIAALCARTLIITALFVSAVIILWENIKRRRDG